MTATISPEALERAAQLFKTDEPVPTTTPIAGQFDVKAYLDKYGIPFKIKTNGDGTIYILEHCLFDSSHTGGDASIIQRGNGALGYKCFHDSCKSYQWKDARRKISGDDKLTQFCSSNQKNPPYSYKSDDSDGGDGLSKENILPDTRFFPIIPFPFEVLPESLRRFIFKLAETLHASPEIVTGAVLTIISGTTGNKIRVGPRQDWMVPVFLWLIIILVTGEGKSPVINSLMEIVYKLQIDFYRDYLKQLSEWEIHKKQKKKSLDFNNEKPTLRHIVTSDCTIEALGKIYSEDGHGLIIHRDELAGFILSLNQYKKKGAGDDLQKYLQLFDCKPFKIDRKTDLPLLIESCGASILGGIQPRVLSEIFSQPTFDNGLFPRFIPIYLEPKIKRFTEKTLSELMKLYWSGLISKCVQMPWDGKPKNIIFNQEARTRWGQFFNEFYSFLPFLSEKAKVFVPKLITYSLKLIGILHVLDHITEHLPSDRKDTIELPVPIISRETVDRGIKLTEYFAGQIMKVLSIHGKESPTINGQIARLAFALNILQGDVVAGRIDLIMIRDTYNEGLPQQAILPDDNRRLSAMLHSAGLETTRGTGGYSVLIWEQSKIEKFIKNNITTITTVTKSDDSDGLFINLREGLI